MVGNQKMKYGNFDCRGFYYEQTFPQNYLNLLSKEIPTLFEAPFEDLALSQNDTFFGRFYFSEGQLAGFHFEANKHRALITPFNMDIIKVLQGPGGMFSFAQKERSEIYDSSINFSLKQKKTKGKYLIYNSSFTKEIVGSGLHRSLKIKFELEADKDMFSPEILKGKCTLAMADILDKGEYIDVEEFENADFKLHTFGLIDIELPDYLSTQHVYLIEKNLERAERKDIDYGRIRVSTVLEYPLHVRYGKPDNGNEKKGKLTSHPSFYFDCLSKSKQLGHVFSDFFDELVLMQVSRFMTKVESVPKEEIVHYSVAIGNSDHFVPVLGLTLILTLGSTLYLAMLMLNAANKRRNCDKLH